MVSTPSIYGILLEGTWKRSVKGYDSFFDEIIFGMIHLYSLQKYLSTLTNNEVSLCKISWMMFHSRPSAQAKHCSWEARRGLGVSMGVKSVMENRRFFIHFFLQFPIYALLFCSCMIVWIQDSIPFPSNLQMCQVWLSSSSFSERGVLKFRYQGQLRF